MGDSLPPIVMIASQKMLMISVEKRPNDKKKLYFHCICFNFRIFHIYCIPHTCHYNHAFGCHCWFCFSFMLKRKACMVCLHICNAPLFIQIIRIESSLNNKNGNKKVAFIINGDKIYAYAERFSFYRQFRVV